MMIGESFLRELEKVLELEPNSLTVGSKLEDIGWDSLAELSFLALVDRTLGRQVEVSKVGSCATVRDLLTLVDQSTTG